MYLNEYGAKNVCKCVSLEVRIAGSAVLVPGFRGCYVGRHTTCACREGQTFAVKISGWREASGVYTN